MRALKIAKLGVLATAAVVVFLSLESPASAVTFTNACRNSLVPTNWDQINVTMTATTPAGPVSPGASVPLTNISLTMAVPGTMFVAGYNLGLLTVGVNNVPGTIHAVIDASNTVDGSKSTNTVGTVFTTTISDPDGTPGTGDETATDGSATVAFADQTWTAGASGTIDFHEHPDTAITGVTGGGIIAFVTMAGFLTVQFHCTPGTVAGSNPGTPTFTTPPTIASTTISPTAVTLRSFSAVESPGGVLLRWRTASETRTLGFNVYVQVGTKRVRLNQRVIGAKAALGTSYLFVDRARRGSAKPRRYWLQVVSLDGSRGWLASTLLRRPAG